MKEDRLRDELLARLASPLIAEEIFDRTPDIVFFVKNAEGQYVIVNRTLAERCGYKHKHALIGKTTLDVFPQQLAEAYAEQDRSILATGAEITDKLELHLYRDRRHGWCLTNKFPLRSADGTVVGMTGFSRDLGEPNAGTSIYPEIAKAIDYVHAHFDEPLRVHELAKIAGLRVSRLERYVKSIFQLTVRQLVTKVRLDAAERLLTTTSMSVADIGYSTGFYDHSAFSRQFRLAVGVRPSEYRRARLSAAETPR